MPTRLLFWLVLYPLSIIPFTILYGFFYFFYFIINYLIGYRKEIINKNLKLSFPEKSNRELRRIRHQYYHHLTQIAAEMLKMLTISKKKLGQRYQCPHPELVNQYFEQGKSVILISSHYNNWEWMVLSLDSLFKHHGVGVGKPNSNKVFEKLINRARTRYGTEVVFADTVRDTFERYETTHQPVTYMMLCDQSPHNSKKCYVTDFLNQKSGIIFGAEYFAKKYDLPVVYYQVIKDKKGYYHIDLELITDRPTETEPGEITKTYVKLLENTIRNHPPYWLWSHKRWKFKFD
ncbi:MAG: lysophospholipid acyltransferase family protein [Bacteroidales bacterium]